MASANGHNRLDGPVEDNYFRLLPSIVADVAVFDT